jgi:hypothetical protein
MRNQLPSHRLMRTTTGFDRGDSCLFILQPPQHVTPALDVTPCLPSGPDPSNPQPNRQTVTHFPTPPFQSTQLTPNPIYKGIGGINPFQFLFLTTFPRQKHYLTTLYLCTVSMYYGLWMTSQRPCRSCEGACKSPHVNLKSVTALMLRLIFPLTMWMASC